MQIAKNKAVTIDYTLTDNQGAVIDSSKGADPLSYLHGAGSIVPGLEKALEGKSAGDQITVTVTPAEGYGSRDESMVQEVPRAAFGKVEVKPGMQFRAQPPGGGGGSRLVTIVDVKADTVRIDANHPLAGKSLHFDVTIVDVRDATQEEIDHGHVHGKGGHHH